MSLSRQTMSALRFSTGIKPGEPVPDGPEALLAQIAGDKPRFSFMTSEEIATRHERLAVLGEQAREARALKRDGDREGSVKAIRIVRRRANRFLAEDQHLRFIRAVASPDGFVERLAAFWVDHFSVDARKRMPMKVWAPLLEAEAIRPRIGGRFADLLKAAIIHPAMLLYLDQNRSAGPSSDIAGRGKNGFNENLGRELLELHTLGVDGGYSQADVRAAALVLTGLTVRRGVNPPSFDIDRAEEGTFTVMGTPFGGDPRSMADVESLLDWLASRPQTARHIARKLAVHFISDNPPTDLVASMEKAFVAHDGDLTAVYRAMLTHPAAWENFGEKARQPYDFLVAGLRALNVPATEMTIKVPEKPEVEMQDNGNLLDELLDDAPPEDMMAMSPMAPADKGADRFANPLTVGVARLMGQPVWQPPSPAGWEEGADVWITSAQLTNRISWARLVAGRYGRDLDPRDFARTILADAARDDTIRIAGQAPSRAAGISFVLASPEFNRR